jgi:Phage integrase family
MAWRPQVHRSPGSARRSLMPCGLVGCGSSQSGCPVGPLARRGGPLRESKWVLGYLKRAVVAANETIARMPEDGRPGELPADLRFYDLRHTCASLLIREGGSIKAVQKQMGHKTAAITLDTYTPTSCPGWRSGSSGLHAEAVAGLPPAVEASSGVVQFRAGGSG